VDNSIVVIENIYRLRNKGIPAARAAVMGANQVAGAIFSSTLTTICVFLPIVFTDGLTRSIMQDMCLTIAYSLSASLVVALTVVPSMSSTLLRKEKETKHRFFDGVITAYEKAAGFCLSHKYVPLGIAVVLLAFSVWQVFRMGIILMPDMASEQMSVSVTMPKENTTEEDYETADQITETITSIEGVETVGAVMTSAASVLSTDDKSYSFEILLNEKYTRKNKEIAAEIEEKLEKMSLEDYTVSSSDMDMSSMLGEGLEVEISGKDNDKLLEISEDVMDMVGEIKGFTEISNGQEDGDTEYVVTVDKDKAMKCGLTVAQVYQELAAALTTEKDSTKITVDDQQYNVTIVDDRDELDTSNLEDYEFETTTTNETGKEITKTYKLSKFAKITKGKSVASLTRKNLVSYVSVTAEVEDGYNTTLLSRSLQKKIDKYELPDGYTIDLGGESESAMEVVKNMLLMITLAVIFIYLIMVAQFQSLLSPFIVIFTIPLAFTGGLLALLISGQELSMMSLMGFLVLSGVVVNNGIVFVDYVNQLRLDGMEKRKALIETGMVRMRPILMTALTTILAMSTMVFSRDTGSDMSRGMATVTIGGLAYATLMTLFVVPALYDIFYRKKEMKRVDLGDEDSLDREEI
jgi:HAE1 family hydrophobic/amphiphilic exporter-1